MKKPSNQIKWKQKLNKNVPTRFAVRTSKELAEWLHAKSFELPGASSNKIICAILEATMEAEKLEI